MRRFPHIVLLALLAVLGVVASASAVPCGADRCKSFPAGGADGAIAPGPDGNVWFAGSGFIGRLTRGGDVTRFPAPTTAGSDVEAGPDNGIWFTAPGTVGRMSTDGQITLHRDVSGGPGPIAPAADGAMWFTSAGGFLSRVASDGDALRSLLPGGRAQARASRAGETPDTMVRGPDGALWIAQSNPAGLARVGADGHVTEVALPQFGHDLGGITAGPDGGLWFTAPSARLIGRFSPTTGRINSFRTSWNPYAITSGPSHAIWFAMTHQGRWTLTRMVPAGYMSFFQVPGPVRGMAAGPDDGVYLAKGATIERFEPFLGAYPIRRRALPVNPFAGSISMRLFCPKFDLVFCAGTIVLRWKGQEVAQTAFSQRVNDAPATRLLLNGLGRRLARRSARVRVIATITQHDQGGVTRVSEHAFYLVRKRRR
jgi:virginiamycin B lyase